MNVTYTQCKQIAANSPLRDFIAELNDQPNWIAPLDIYDIHAIQQGGCESGAYMPAVTYYDARQTMNEYGDDVLDYIESTGLDLPVIPRLTSWSSIAVIYLSCAVELWCGRFDLDGVNWS